MVQYFHKKASWLCFQSNLQNLKTNTCQKIPLKSLKLIKREWFGMVSLCISDVAK